MVPSLVGRPREHDARTRLALLDAAEALVARGGLDAVSVRAVADEIGTSVRAVYSVFGSKEGLIRGLAERGFQLLMDGVDSAPLTSDPATDLAAAAIRGFRPFAIEHPDLFRLVFVWSGIDLGPDVGAAGKVALRRLEARLESARAAGLLPERPSSELGLEFHALCQGLASLELCGAIARAQADRLWADSIDDLLTGWLARARTSRALAGAADSPARLRRRNSSAPDPK